MTNLTFLGILPGLLVACTTEPAPPQKVYDFAPAQLGDIRIVDPKPTEQLSKHEIRHAIQRVQRELLGCYTTHGEHATGTLELQLRLVGGPEGTLVDAVELGGDARLAGNAALGDCMQTLVMSIELPAMAEPAVWQVSYPFVVGTAP